MDRPGACVSYYPLQGLSSPFNFLFLGYPGQLISRILATEMGCSPLQRSALSGVGERYTEPLTRGHVWAATSHSECVSCGQAGWLGQPLVPRNEMLQNKQPGLASVCTSSADVSLAQVTDG